MKTPVPSIGAAEEREYWRAAADALAGRSPTLIVDDASRGGFVRWIADTRIGVLLQEQCRAASRADPIWTELMPVIHRELAVGALQERELRRLFDAFTASGISPILLKGAALAYTLYGNPAVRPRQDVDFLIRESDQPVMRRVLLGRGYVSELDVPGGLVSSQVHFSRADAFDVVHACDVHLKMSNSLAYADYLTYEDLLADAIRCRRLHPAALAPAPFHSLVIACVHRIAHHYDVDDLMWLWDIHLIASSLGEDEWTRVCELSRARGLSSAVLRGLTRAQQAFGGRYDRVRQRLAADARNTGDTRPAFDQQTTMLQVVVSDVRTLSRLRDRVRLVRDHLFPPLWYLRQKYPQWPRALLPLAYVYRIGRGAPGWLRARRR